MQGQQQKMGLQAELEIYFSCLATLKELLTLDWSNEESEVAIMVVDFQGVQGEWRDLWNTGQSLKLFYKLLSVYKLL